MCAVNSVLDCHKEIGLAQAFEWNDSMNFIATIDILTHKEKKKQLAHIFELKYSNRNKLNVPQKDFQWTEKSEPISFFSVTFTFGSQYRPISLSFAHWTTISLTFRSRTKQHPQLPIN